MTGLADNIRLRPRLKDVAALARVSQSTCSAILSERSGYYASDATRKKVVQAAEQLGYRPNRFASSLRTNRTRQVGCMQPNVYVDCPAIGEKFCQIEEQAIRRGYRLLICSHHHDPRREIDYIRSFLADRVDGLLLYTGSTDSGELVEQMLADRYPVATLESPFAFATPDARVRHELGGYQQVMHLWNDAGRRKLAFLVGGMLAPAGKNKVLGHRNALAELGSSLHEHVFIDSTQQAHVPVSTYDDGLTMARQLIACGRGFDGIVMTSDSYAPGVFKALAEAGLRVPDDVAVIGYDDIPLARVQPVALTTIRQPREIGSRVFDLLMRMIDDGMPQAPDDYEQIVLDTQLIVRDSTGVEAHQQNPQRYSSRAVRSE